MVVTSTKKNGFQICNLIYQYENFGIIAEWHVQATAHGKYVCNGLEATFKREAAWASSQAKWIDAISTPNVLFTWGEKISCSTRSL